LLGAFSLFWAIIGDSSGLSAIQRHILGRCSCLIGSDRDFLWARVEFGRINQRSLI